MLVKRSPDLTYKDVTPKGAYANRRNFLLGLLATTGAVAGWKKFSYLVSGPGTGSVPVKLNGVPRNEPKTTYLSPAMATPPLP